MPSLSTHLVSRLVAAGFLLAAAGCSGSSGASASGGAATLPAQSIPGIVNLDDADSLIEDLRGDPEIKAELSAELAIQLELPAADADCLAEEIDVEDLLAMSQSPPEAESAADEVALERILEAFDVCGVPRSVFDQ